MGAPLDREACLRYQAAADPADLQRLRHDRGVLEHVPAPVDLPEHAGSAGRACTDDDVAVVRIYEDRHADPDDHAAKDGTEVGEVAVRSVKSGYAYVNQPDEQAAALPRRLAVHRRPGHLGRGRVRDDRRAARTT